MGILQGRYCREGMAGEVLQGRSCRGDTVQALVCIIPMAGITLVGIRGHRTSMIGNPCPQPGKFNKFDR